jgi:polysaccharide pyruvyl transferase WcaK-like protein
MPPRGGGAGAAAPRVGLFGKLGSGNIGNDASMEAVLSYLTTAHPDATVDAMSAGWKNVTSRYGIPAIPMCWYHRYEHAVSGIPAIAFKIAGKGIDVFRTAAWVRRHDAVIVPGMGVLEASLPLRATEFPYAMFLVCGLSRLFGTKVALVSVGAGVINQRMTRWLFNQAARFAFYRSFRNAGSRDAMRDRGVDTAGDHVYPDLAFALPVPAVTPGDPQVVCVGVMEYHGNNDDRARADEIRSSYVDGMKRFIGWLVDHDRKVRLIVGDTNGSDDGVVREILAGLLQTRPDLDPSAVVTRPVVSIADVMQEILPASSVVAIRFHNVLAALKLGKPTIAISYSPKHDALMADMGVSRFCQPVYPFDFDLLIQRFAQLQTDAAQVRQDLMEHNAANEQLLREQFTELSAALFASPRPPRASASEPARTGLRLSRAMLAPVRTLADSRRSRASAYTSTHGDRHERPGRR